MIDDITIPVAALGGAGTLLSVIGGWLLNSHDKRLEKIETQIAATAAVARSVATSLAAYQLDSEKRFAKEDSVQASLARIHNRLDDTATSKDVRELRDDIKVLIGKTGAT
jgi:hypothetical protein